jgi:hydrophobic/amphiphilic exporter-1 (mainly G- bacteria), HAE1 family
LMLFGFIGLDFFPAGDQSEVDVTLTMPAGTSLQETDNASRQAEQILHGYPEVRSVYTALGQAVASGGPGSVLGSNNLAQISALLVPPRQRGRSAAAVAEDMRHALEGRIPFAKIQIGLTNSFGFGGFTGAAVQVQVQGPNASTVDQVSRQLQQVVASVPGAVGIQNSDDNVQTQIRATFDWSRAADLGISARDAGTALRAALDGVTSNASVYRQSGRTDVPIRVLTANADTMTAQQIARMPVSGARGVVNLG